MQAKQITIRRTESDRDLLIAEVSGTFYGQLMDRHADQLGGMIGVSMYLVSLVDKFINSDEYKQAVLLEEYEGVNRWRYFELVKQTSLDWYFLQKIGDEIGLEYELQTTEQ